MLIVATFGYTCENQRRVHHAQPSQEQLQQKQLHPASERTHFPDQRKEISQVCSHIYVYLLTTDIISHINN